MGQDPRTPHYSPDGLWWWDGTSWRPVAPQPAPRPAGGMPVGAIVAAVAVVLVVVIATVSVLAYLGFKRINDSLTNTSVSIVERNAIPCDQLEHTQVHYHAALQIFVAGSPLAIPTDLGRTRGCYYWLHMHTNEEGIIHIEAPSDRTFTLGDFFGVWSAWSGDKQLIDSRHVSTIALDSSQKLLVYVDSGSGPRAYTGDPGSIVLDKHEVITLEVSPPTINPPSFHWPPGF